MLSHLFQAKVDGTIVQGFCRLTRFHEESVNGALIGVLHLEDASRAICRAVATTVVMATGDRLILATNGIDTVPANDLAVIFGQPLDQADESLIAAIRAANDPNQDNVTVVILEVVEGSAP